MVDSWSSLSSSSMLSAVQCALSLSIVEPWVNCCKGTATDHGCANSSHDNTYVNYVIKLNNALIRGSHQRFSIAIRLLFATTIFQLPYAHRHTRNASLISQKCADGLANYGCLTFE